MDNEYSKGSAGMSDNVKGAVLGIDYGDVRTGFASSDSMRTLATGIGTVKAKGMHELTEYAVKLAGEHNCTLIVIGNPINMDGSAGFRSEKIEMLRGVIEEMCDIPVELYDERCSTMLAHRFLSATDTRGAKRKNAVDTLSAQIILQDYLDYEKRKNN